MYHYTLWSLHLSCLMRAFINYALNIINVKIHICFYLATLWCKITQWPPISVNLNITLSNCRSNLYCLATSSWHLITIGQSNAMQQRFSIWQGKIFHCKIWNALKDQSAPFSLLTSDTNRYPDMPFRLNNDRGRPLFYQRKYKTKKQYHPLLVLCGRCFN